MVTLGQVTARNALGRQLVQEFRPGDGANPHIGLIDALEKVEEARVETLCVGEDVVKKARRSFEKMIRVLSVALDYHHRFLS